MQPDLIAVCDPGKLERCGCLGAPDLIIEILSHSTSRKDLAVKVPLYERHGVPKVRVIDPGNAYVQVYLLSDTETYPEEPEIFEIEETLDSAVLDGFSIPLKELFSVD